jgi:hypothetical protein
MDRGQLEGNCTNSHIHKPQPFGVVWVPRAIAKMGGAASEAKGLSFILRSQPCLLLRGPWTSLSLYI